MAPGCIFQIFLRVTVQNQIRIAQRVIIDEIVQFRSAAPWSRPVHPRPRCSQWKFFSHLGAVNSTHPVSILNKQALASYFIIISSKSCYWLTVYDKVSEFCAVHGSLHCCTRRKRKIRTLLQSEIGSDFSCLVGAGGFEPPKLKSSRFTVCPHWPLGNTPIFIFTVRAGLPVYLTTAPDGSLSTFFAANYFAVMRRQQLFPKEKPPRNLNGFRCGFIGAGDRS